MLVGLELLQYGEDDQRQRVIRAVDIVIVYADADLALTTAL